MTTLTFDVLYGQHQMIHFSNVLPVVTLDAVFQNCKRELEIEEDASEFLFWHFRPLTVSQMPIGEIHFNQNKAEMVLIRKNDYETLDKFNRTILPSLVFESTQIEYNVTDPNGNDLFRIVKSIQETHNSFHEYDDEDLKATIVSLLPPHIFGIEDPDEKVKEITRWFKEEFFRWAKDFKCHICQGNTHSSGISHPTPSEFKYFARNVELYKCDQCGAITRFPRYNKVEKLFETRVGRCGEWANAFTAVLYALGFDVRYVHDWTDHVWTEYWCEAKKRYVHIDPCENIIDQPLTYEAGWNKKLKWIVAINNTQCIDVTNRYTRHKEEVIARRRTEVDEESFQKAIAFYNQVWMATAEPAEKEIIIARQRDDLMSMISVRDNLNAEEQRNRISGNE